MIVYSRSVGAPPRSSRSTISRIAVGVDGLPEGCDAAVLGAALADVTGADLMLAGIHPAPLVPVPPMWSWEHQRHDVESGLKKVRDRLAPAARIVAATDNSVPRALNRVVRHHHRDLLIVGSSRQAPAGTVRIGKRTRGLLSHACCALAVAPRGFADRNHVKLRTIGVGYDDASESEAALELAASIALVANAKLYVRSVVDDRIPLLLRSPWSSLLDEQWREVVDAEAGRIKKRAHDALLRTEVPSFVEVAFGRPAAALLELSSHVDLLVIGSRRWGPAGRVLLGSTGEAVLHDAACPVLTVPRRAASAS